MGDAVHHGQQEEGGRPRPGVSDGAGGNFRIIFFREEFSKNYISSFELITSKDILSSP